MRGRFDIMRIIGMVALCVVLYATLPIRVYAADPDPAGTKTGTINDIPAAKALDSKPGGSTKACFPINAAISQ